MKNKKEINSFDVKIIFSVIGMIASLLVIIVNLMKKESGAVGIGLLCSCSASLATNIKHKKDNK